VVWKILRAERPLFWQDRARGEGFWAVTRRADVCRVLGEHETFTSEGGTAISMLDAPDPAAGIMMHSTDPPRHQQFREQLGKPFSPRAVRAYEQQVRTFVRDAIKPARDGEVWDAAASFSRLPMTVGAMLMGLPDADIDPLVRLAYASLAPDDPRYKIAGSAVSNAVSAHYKIIDYFTRCIDSRKSKLGNDLISHFLAAEIGERTPNRHVAFGSGPHLCLGSHLARLMLRNSFDELVASIESFELADPPVHLVSNEIAGVVSLPLRIGLRTRMMPTAS
jgi:cytochrome P450